MSNATERRIQEVLTYCANYGDTDTCKHFDIKSETLGRYKRKAKFYEKKIPKILLFDVETTPLICYSWTLYPRRLSHDNIIKDWNILSWSAKWLFDATVMGEVLTPEEARDGDDKRIMTKLWKFFEDSDVIISHNGKKFDHRRSNTRFILNGLQPPTPYQVIDTLEVARKHFSFPSNRLDYLGQLIRQKGKIETDYSLWKKCMNGDKESLDYMLQYNKEDVLLLEETYLFLRGYIKSHPNLAVYAETTEEICPNCTSPDLECTGEYGTPAGLFLSYRCKSCGAISRCRASNLSIKQRRALLTSTAR